MHFPEIIDVPCTCYNGCQFVQEFTLRGEGLGWLPCPKCRGLVDIVQLGHIQAIIDWSSAIWHSKSHLHERINDPEDSEEMECFGVWAELSKVLTLCPGKLEAWVRNKENSQKDDKTGDISSAWLKSLWPQHQNLSFEIKGSNYPWAKSGEELGCCKLYIRRPSDVRGDMKDRKDWLPHLHASHYIYTCVFHDGVPGACSSICAPTKKEFYDLGEAHTIKTPGRPTFGYHACKYTKYFKAIKKLGLVRWAGAGAPTPACTRRRGTCRRSS